MAELTRTERQKVAAAKWRKKNPNYVRDHYRKNRDRLAAKSRAYSKLHDRERKYGLTELQYQAMLLAQSGNCAICACAMASPHVDHNHFTRKTRGLLCGSCNRGIGMFKESAKSLRVAADYLEQHRG